MGRCWFVFCSFFSYLFLPVGYNLLVLQWFDLVGEFFDSAGCLSTDSIWFSTMPALQQSFNSGCCLYPNELFTYIEYFCNLSSPCAVLKKVCLVYGSSGTVGKSIACCWILLDMIQYLFLYLYCIYHLGFVVRVITLCGLWIHNSLFLIWLYIYIYISIYIY